MKKKNLYFNKKGQFETKLLAIISIVIVGVLIFFVSHMNNALFTQMDEYFNDSDYNGSLAQTKLQRIQTVDRSVWDYAFLAIFAGFVLQIILFSFATRISPAFFWIDMIINIPLLIIGVVTSNIWQELAASPSFAETIARFPITDAILGSYYPIAVIIIIFISSIALFGKPAGSQ